MMLPCYTQFMRQVHLLRKLQYFYVKIIKRYPLLITMIYVIWCQLIEKNIKLQCVGTLVILRTKFHVVSSLLIISKIAILMLALKCPMHSHWKWVWAENDDTVNLKSASLVVIMLLQEDLTHIHSQKKPRLHLESFALNLLTQENERKHFIFVKSLWYNNMKHFQRITNSTVMCKS